MSKIQSIIELLISEPDLKNKEIISRLLASGITIKLSDISNARIKLKKTKSEPILDFNSLRKIREFVDDIGGISILEDGIKLLKEFSLQCRNFNHD